MRTIKIGFLLTTILFMAVGCGTSKKASRTYHDDIFVRDDAPKKVLHPQGGDRYYEKTTDKSTKRSAGTSMTFSEAESQHIRVSGVNPLPENGVLEVDLSQLRSEFCYPYYGNFISDYGVRGQVMHTGIDIKTLPNDTVRAVLPGVVRMSKSYSSYGNVVVIRHYCGFETVYAHFASNLVAVNDVVEAGDPIGLAGRTGRASTEHLHFELRADGEHVDPKKLLDVDNHTIQRGMLYFQRLDNDLIAYSSQEELDRIKNVAWNIADNKAPKTPTVNPLEAAPTPVTPTPSVPTTPAPTQTTTSSSTSSMSALSSSSSANTASSSSSSISSEAKPIGYINDAPKDKREEVTVQKAPTSTQTSSNAGRSTNNTSVNDGSATYHIVQKGDTLYAIARKYSTTVKKICEINGIDENAYLQLNQKVRVK